MAGLLAKASEESVMQLVHQTIDGISGRAHPRFADYNKVCYRRDYRLAYLQGRDNVNSLDMELFGVA